LKSDKIWWSRYHQENGFRYNSYKGGTYLHNLCSIHRNCRQVYATYV